MMEEIKQPVGFIEPELESTAKKRELKNLLSVPYSNSKYKHVYNQYTIKVNKTKRDKLQDYLKKKNMLWRKRRQLFYGNVDANNMSVQFLTSFYKELFRNMGLTTIFTNSIPRHNPHLDYFIFMLRKNDIQYRDSLKTFDWISLDPLFSRNQ